jgi:hypothetical protein
MFFVIPGVVRGTSQKARSDECPIQTVGPEPAGVQSIHTIENDWDIKFLLHVNVPHKAGFTTC